MLHDRNVCLRVHVAQHRPRAVIEPDHALGDHYFARLRFRIEPLSAV